MQYVVKKDDTLESIAKSFSITKEKIKEYNNLTDDIIEIGMIINIPYVSYLDYYIAREDDDFYSVANKFSMPISILLQINGIKENEYLYPKQQLIVPKEGNKIYLTEKYDTFNSIANKLGISVLDIDNLNKCLYLSEGQVVIYKDEKN